MDAGKWIARNRGPEDIEQIEVAQVVPATQARFTLADRLDPIELVLMYSFREGLREA